MIVPITDLGRRTLYCLHHRFNIAEHERLRPFIKIRFESVQCDASNSEPLQSATHDQQCQKPLLNQVALARSRDPYQMHGPSHCVEYIHSRFSRLVVTVCRLVHRKQFLALSVLNEPGRNDTFDKL